MSTVLPESAAISAGLSAALSAVFEYFPVLKTVFDKWSETTKRTFWAVASFVVAAVIFIHYNPGFTFSSLVGEDLLSTTLNVTFFVATFAVNVLSSVAGSQGWHKLGNPLLASDGNKSDGAAA